MLTDADIAGMRTTVASSLIDAASHTRPTATADAEGNVLLAAGAATTLACWLVHPDRNGTDPRNVGGQAGQALDPVVLLAYDADVRPGDYLDVSSQRYVVRATSADRLYLRAEVGRVDR